MDKSYLMFNDGTINPAGKLQSGSNFVQWFGKREQ
jgi:hypothetical protein